MLELCRDFRRIGSPIHLQPERGHGLRFATFGNGSTSRIDTKFYAALMQMLRPFVFPQNDKRICAKWTHGHELRDIW